MILLVATAYAHTETLPHVHAADPLSVGLVGFWVVAGFVWLAVAYRDRSLPDRRIGTR